MEIGLHNEMNYDGIYIQSDFTALIQLKYCIGENSI